MTAQNDKTDDYIEDLLNDISSGEMVVYFFLIMLQF